MARQNIVFLYARVSKLPVLSKDKSTGELNYGMVYVDTVRGLREVDDDVRYVKHDYPLIISREKNILDNIMEWKENDIVFIKGAITSKKITKSSYCPECADENGNAFKNMSLGNLLYITPIYVKKMASYETKEDAVKDIVDNREISNQVYIVGTLVKLSFKPIFFVVLKSSSRPVLFSLAI